MNPFRAMADDGYGDAATVLARAFVASENVPGVLTVLRYVALSDSRLGTLAGWLRGPRFAAMAFWSDEGYVIIRQHARAFLDC